MMPRERNSRGLTPKDTIAVCGEGDKTERLYFNKIKTDNNLSNLKYFGKKEIGGNTPDRIVQFAINLADTNKRRGVSVTGERWCVFDRDKHTYYDSAIIDANANGIKIAHSNPSFELWYLLHFKYRDGRVDNNQLKKELKTEFRKMGHNTYDKSKCYYKDLLDKQDFAIQNAKRLSKNGYKNPSTDVYKLVERLNKL